MSGAGVRRAVSAVECAWGVIVAVVCGALLVAPLLDVGLLPDDVGGSEPVGWLVFPLTVSVGEAVALLLAWAAVRGYWCARVPALWGLRQRPALWACAIGAALALFCAATAGSPWTGMPTTARFDGFLALTVHSAVALLVMLTLRRDQGAGA